MSHLIREFIRWIVNERIRSKLFDVKLLNDVEHHSEVDSIARMSGLELLGQGSSRNTYLLSSRKVLKVVGGTFNKPKIGLAQNRVEVKTYQDSPEHVKRFITRVFDHHQRFWWIISELVRPVKDKSELNSLIGLSPKHNMKDVVMLTRARDKIDSYASPGGVQKLTEFVVAIDHFLNQVGLIEQDIVALEHWGVTVDQRPVLLDSGYDESARQEYVKV